MAYVSAIDDDDFLVSPRLIEQRRTGVVAPLSARGLCGLVEDAPRELAVLGIGVTPENIVQRVRSLIERGVGWRHYTQPSNEDFQAVTDQDRLEEFCGAFETLYGNGSIFRERMSKSEIKELIDAYEMDMPIFGEDLRLPAWLRLN